MSNCIMCGEEHKRLRANSKSIPAKYCSTKCIKRASYLKQNPNTKSFYRGDKAFWKTETGKGFKWEVYMAEKYKCKHMPFNKDGIDVVCPIGNIDVKVCEKYGSQWVFNRNSKKNCIDYYFCICLENGLSIKELLIPSGEFMGRGITVGTISKKYDKYIV